MRSRRVRWWAALPGAGLAFWLSACPEEDHPPLGAPTAESVPAGWFADVTDEAGIDFVHCNGASGRKYLIETNGSGATWIDRQGDGRLDVFLVQGAPLPGWVGDETALHDRLFDQFEPGRFRDSTQEAEIRSRGQGMAAAAPDVENDGDSDLFVSRFGKNSLLKNDGQGRFADVTDGAGLGDSASYHSSCAFADLDRDGDLDLWVVGYVDFRIEDNPICGDIDRGPDYRTYCSPDMFAAVDDSLYANDGSGQFSNVSASAGLVGSGGKGLGIALADLDDDGDLEVFVANDSDVNHLWRNDGGLKFVECAAEYGVDFNGEGRTEACMGCDFGDVDDDGDLDLFTVNLANETNTLWMREGSAFHDRSAVSGLASPSTLFVGFGALLTDLDRDGKLDAVVANGHVLDNATMVNPRWTHEQRPHLYHGLGKGRFELLPAETAGPYFAEANVGRGIALADFDDDGDLDLLFTNNGGRARLQENRSDPEHNWVGFRLVGTRSPRDAVGARVMLEPPLPPRSLQVRGGGSYLCDHDRRLLFGLPADAASVDVRVVWPDGAQQRVAGLSARTYHTLTEAR